MHNKKFLFHTIYVPSALCLVPLAATAAVRVGNYSRSYAESYNQLNQQRAQYNAQMAAPATMPGVTTTTDNATATTTAITELPVRVANANLAAAIARGDKNTSVGITDLESCARVYPDGEFAWDNPSIGQRAGGNQTCVATVEIRGYQMGAYGEDVVLARANLAAGDMVKCNISEFPEISYTGEVTNIIFPADNEPTMNDVIRVMNDEQKKNAGIKIAAGAVIGGLAGNVTGKNDVGHDGLIGTSRGKMNNTAIGALSGAALMAGNAYTGKIAGDTILSTGVNAAAGAAVGNMVATGDSVLRIEDCTINGERTSCLWGVVTLNTPLTTLESGAQTAFYNTTSRETILCDNNMQKCTQADLASIKLEKYDDLETAATENYQAIMMDSAAQYRYDKTKNEVKLGYADDGSGMWAKIATAGTADRMIPAMVAGVQDKTFGFKSTDWRKWRTANGDNARIWGRSGRGEAYDLGDQVDGKAYSLNDFMPLRVDADDGALIDFNNKARLKGTLTGAGVGAGLGALTGYQGAQSDVEQRWLSAVREYKDSLQKVYCATGKRFLGYYNDSIIIPNTTE
ncbi:MAG: hypothetical protein K2L95_01500 [Alphaproteobacteria bacterium]|nr:hypothetical protein [Alphaproteobacteria bacterium]